MKHIRTYTNTQAPIAKLSKSSILSDFVSLFGVGMYENDQEKKYSYVEAVEQSLQNTVGAIQVPASNYSLFDKFDNFNRLRPESPKGRYVYYCVGLYLVQSA